MCVLNVFHWAELLSIVSEFATICLKWNARNFRLMEERTTTKAWINNAIYFELCIKANTLAHAPHTHSQTARTHTHTTNLSMDSQPLYMVNSNHSQLQMICKYFIIQGQGVDKSTKVSNEDSEVGRVTFCWLNKQVMLRLTLIIMCFGWHVRTCQRHWNSLPIKSKVDICRYVCLFFYCLLYLGDFSSPHSNEPVENWTVRSCRCYFF